MLAESVLSATASVSATAQPPPPLAQRICMGLMPGGSQLCTHAESAEMILSERDRPRESTNRPRNESEMVCRAHGHPSNTDCIR